jgi:beta-glucosidase
MQLKHFSRVFLKKGETQRISFRIGENELSLLNSDLQRVVEPGTFSLMIGASSNDLKLQSKLVVE